MAQMDVTLIGGTGERQDSLWEGRCPACQEVSEFSHEYYDVNITFYGSKGKILLEIKITIKAIGAVCRSRSP
jgi:hypothetical protein